MIPVQVQCLLHLPDRRPTSQHRQSPVLMLSKAGVHVSESKNPPRKTKEPFREESLQV